MISLPGESPTVLHHTLICKLNRPGVRAPGRCCFLTLAERLALPVVAACDEHETDNREPGNREGNDHVVVLSI